MVHEARTFPNGLRLVVNRTNSPFLCVLVRVNAGIELEKKKEEGITSLITKILLCGTEKFPSRKNIMGKIKSFGGIPFANAYLDCIELGISALTPSFGRVVETLSGMVFDSEFRFSDVEICKKELINDLKLSENSVSDLCHDNLRAMMFPTCGLGKEIFGRRLSIEKLDKNYILKYWLSVLHPKNIIISITGDIDIDTAHELVMKEFYAKLLKIEGKQVKAAKIEVGPFKKRELIVSKKLFQSRIQIGFPSFPFSDSNHQAVLLSAQLLTEKLKDVLNQKPGFYNVSCYSRTFENNGMFFIDFATEPSNVVDFVNTIAYFLKRFVIEGMTEEVFKAAKEQYKTKFVSMVEYGKPLCKFAARFWSLKGKPFSIEDKLAVISSISLKTCINQISQIVSGDCFVSYVGKPEKNLQNNLASAFYKV